MLLLVQLFIVAPIVCVLFLYLVLVLLCSTKCHSSFAINTCTLGKREMVA